MSQESLLIDEAETLDDLHSAPTFYLDMESVSDPGEWWKHFVRLVQQNGPEGKVVHESETDRSLDWAASVGSQILSSPVQANDSRRKILQYIVNTPGGIGNVLRMLQDSLNTKAFVGLSLILRECANPRNGSLRLGAIRKLVDSSDHLDAIIGMLASLQNLRQAEGTGGTSMKSDYYIASVNLIWVLSAMAEKDNHFVSKVRTMSKVKFLHAIMKSYFFGKSHTHYPLLKIFRVLARNFKVAVILGKDKIMKLFVKVFNTFNNQPSTKFMLVFDILNQLTKSQENCRRFLKAGLLISVMRAFSYWSLWRGKGLLKFSKRVTAIYSHLASTRAGKKALVQTDALLNCKKFCELCPSERAFDTVIMKIAGIVYVAYQKDQIPLENVQSPANFGIPKSQSLKYSDNKDTGSSSDEDDPDDIEDVAESDDGDDDDMLEEAISDCTLQDENDISIDELIIGDDQSVTSKDSKVRSKSKKGTSFSDHNLSTNGKGDHIVKLDHSMSSHPPEVAAERLSKFATFFRELDGSVLVETCNIDNSMVTQLVSNNNVGQEEYPFLPKSEPKFFWLSDHPEYGSTECMKDLRATYVHISSRTRSVLPFVKIAYPDLVLSYGAKRLEYINATSDRACLRSKLLSHISRASHEIFKPKVVYDLDALLKRPDRVPSKKNSNKIPKAQPVKASTNLLSNNEPVTSTHTLKNEDESMVGNFNGRKDNVFPPALLFESRFESGNLRKAIQVGEKEYDLYLMSDVNSNRHNQWFYFQVSNTQENCYYTFNIMNCIKGNSQFNYGMQPVVFSVGDALEGKPGWHRAGTNICYFRNGIRNMTSKKKKGYQTATFTLSFSRRGDVCYIAYHYPYTYSRMLTEIKKLLKLAQDNPKVTVRYDVLCESLNHNEVPLLTITGKNDKDRPIELREVIVLSSRVHPGESNSSWVMHGILHKLLLGAENMDSILQRYVFKIIPMLNVEGVINGCHRCGLTNEDLNRRWKSPDPVMHPTIYNAKGLIEFCCKVRNKTPILFCDLHGHSRKKNVFFYGCSQAKSWNESDRLKSEDPNFIHLLPEAVARRNPAFSITSCNFDVRKSRETTARVSVWREFGIARSYTLESSYCGCDRGPYKGLCMGINHLIEVGENLCEAIEEFYKRPILSVSEYSITSPQNPSSDPSTVNFCSLEDPSWSDQNEAPSPSSSETDYGNSETDDEWNQISLNPIIC